MKYGPLKTVTQAVPPPLLLNYKQLKEKTLYYLYVGDGRAYVILTPPDCFGNPKEYIGWSLRHDGAPMVYGVTSRHSSDIINGVFEEVPKGTKFSFEMEA